MSKPAVLPKPPPGGVFCSRILQPHLERTEYKCECCRNEVLEIEDSDDDNKQEKKATDARCEIVDLLDSSDDDDGWDRNITEKKALSQINHADKENNITGTRTPQKPPTRMGPPKSNSKTVILSSSEEEEEEYEPRPQFARKPSIARRTPKKIESSSEDEDWNANGAGDVSSGEESLADLMNGLSVGVRKNEPRSARKPRYNQRLEDLNFSDSEEEDGDDCEDSIDSREDPDESDLSFIVPDDEESFYSSDSGDEGSIDCGSSQDSDSENVPPTATTKPRKISTSKDFIRPAESSPPLRKPKKESVSSPTIKPRINATTLTTKSKPQSPQMSIKEFKKQRETLAKETFSRFDRVAFQGKLASVELTWSNKLNTTAGMTRLITVGRGTSQERKEAKIELATKIIDDVDRLHSTLLHEMVHAAAWLIDGISKPAHGACFKKWANIAMRKIPGVIVTTTHSYEIEYKYAWACTNSNCSVVVKRHSKSVDVERQICARCKSKLVEIEAPKRTEGKSKQGAIDVDKTPRKKAPPSAYNLFIKDNSKRVRERLDEERREQGDPSKVSQGEVMKECARLWKEQKADS